MAESAGLEMASGTSSHQPSIYKSHDDDMPLLSQPAPRSPRPLHMFFKLFALWITTTILTALIVILAVVYRAKGTITSTQKDTYNFLSTGLILILGLSFFEAFKELARILQPIINRVFLPQGEAARLVDSFDSLLKVSKLVITKTSFWLRIFCIIWLIINLIVQMAAALVSLTATVDDGNNYNTTYTRAGKVSASNLTCYFSGYTCPSWRVSTHGLAHAQGETTLVLGCGKFTDVGSVVDSRQDHSYYCRNDRHNQAFAYRFNEYNLNDTQKAYPFFTNRTLMAWSGKCQTYNETATADTIVGDTNGLKISYTNGTTNGTISIPNPDLGGDGTTYIYRGPEEPSENDATYKCGDRCIRMWVYRNGGTTQGPLFFECPIYFSTVSNVSQSAHQLSDGLLRTAAASIALQGRYELHRKDRDFTQYQYYASGSDWSIHGLEPDQVGANMARFAMGSITSMISRNPKIQIDGTTPYLGSQLTIKTKYFSGLLVFIVSAHFTVFALTYWVARINSR